MKKKLNFLEAIEIIIAKAKLDIKTDDSPALRQLIADAKVARGMYYNEEVTMKKRLASSLKAKGGNFSDFGVRAGHDYYGDLTA